MATIDDLPPEVLGAIMGQLARVPVTQDYYFYEVSWGTLALENARLVCRAWNRAVVPHFFGILHLTSRQYLPDDPTWETSDHSFHDDKANPEVLFNGWDARLDMESARDVARCVVVDSIPRIFCSLCDWETWREWKTADDAAYPGFETALRRISELPRLQAVEIHFSGGYSSEMHGLEGCSETRTSRRNTLEAVLCAIQERKLKGDPEFRTVTHLGLKTLPNMAGPEFETFSLFPSIMNDIRHLHLYISTEHNSVVPEHNTRSVERITFEPRLQAGLLLSVAGQLTTLTLSFDRAWGTLPGYFNGAGLDFARLKALHLWYFVISHDDHFDWVLRMPALASLFLSKTAIMTHARTTAAAIETWRPKSHGWKRLPDGAYGSNQWPHLEGANTVFTYGRRWNSLFDRIRLELRTLVDFRISWQVEWFSWKMEAPWTMLPKADAAPACMLKRYVAFDGGLYRFRPGSTQVMTASWIMATRTLGRRRCGAAHGRTAIARVR